MQFTTLAQTGAMVAAVGYIENRFVKAAVPRYLERKKNPGKACTRRDLSHGRTPCPECAL